MAVFAPRAVGAAVAGGAFGAVQTLCTARAIAAMGTAMAGVAALAKHAFGAAFAVFAFELAGTLLDSSALDILEVHYKVPVLFGKPVRDMDDAV